MQNASAVIRAFVDDLPMEDDDGTLGEETTSLNGDQSPTEVDLDEASEWMNSPLYGEADCDSGETGRSSPSSAQSQAEPVFEPPTMTGPQDHGEEEDWLRETPRGDGSNEEIEEAECFGVEGGRVWMKNGLLHKTGGLPAVESAFPFYQYYSGYPIRGDVTEWFEDGVRGREGGQPAFVVLNRYKARRQQSTHDVEAPAMPGVRTQALPAIEAQPEVGVRTPALPVIEALEMSGVRTMSGTTLDGGETNLRCWYKDGLLHRDDDLPAIEITVADKVLVRTPGLTGASTTPQASATSSTTTESEVIRIWFKYGRCHRDGDKPAYEGRGVRVWVKYGQLQRGGGKGPAFIRSPVQNSPLITQGESLPINRSSPTASGMMDHPLTARAVVSRTQPVVYRHSPVAWTAIPNDDITSWWAVGGFSHRRGSLPALTYSSGRKNWLAAGLLHREDGPAFIAPGASSTTTVGDCVQSSSVSGASITGKAGVRTPTSGWASIAVRDCVQTPVAHCCPTTEWWFHGEKIVCDRDVEPSSEPSVV